VFQPGGAVISGYLHGHIEVPALLHKNALRFLLDPPPPTPTAVGRIAAGLKYRRLNRPT
jgi:hypothetical protein